MIVTPSTESNGYDIDAHVKALEAKRETIVAFCFITGRVLGKVVPAKTADEWAGALGAMIGFDIDQSISILKYQKGNRHTNLARHLAQLIEARDRVEAQIAQATENCKVAIKKMSGQEAPEEMISTMTAPLAANLAEIESAITQVQSQIEAPEPPNAAA